MPSWSTTRCRASTGWSSRARFGNAGFTRPIIVCSAYLDAEVEREARSLGAETVSKSDLQELVETVRREVKE